MSILLKTITKRMEESKYWQNVERIARLEKIVTKGVWGEHSELFGGWRIAHMPKKEQDIIKGLLNDKV